MCADKLSSKESGLDRGAVRSGCYKQLVHQLASFIGTLILEIKCL